LEDRRNVGESSYNSGDGTDQMVKSLMFMMMMMMMMMMMILKYPRNGREKSIETYSSVQRSEATI
jgi:preprotein translocase subunit YajC